MATKKPRITVTLDQRQYEVLSAICSLSGHSMSHFINDLLYQSLPVLERMAESFRRIAQVRDQEKQRITVELDLAQSAIEPMVDGVLDQFDLFVSRLEKLPAAAASAEASGNFPTPVTNRGVTSPRPTVLKTSNRKGSVDFSCKQSFLKKGVSKRGKKS